MGFFQLSAAFEHVESSVFRVVIGFVLAALIGVGIGLLAGRYQKLAAFLMPPLATAPYSPPTDKP